MVNKGLVGVEYATGLEVLRALDRANLDISVAMWILIEDYYADWRFLLSSRRLDDRKAVEGMHVGHCVIGEVFVDDGIVYRIR